MDDLELLSRMRADVPEVDPLVLRRARRELLARAVGPRLVRTRRRRMANRVAVAAGLGALLAVGLVATDSLTSGGRPVTGATAEAADLLNQAATHATDPRIGPGQYRYVVTHAWYSNTAGDGGNTRSFLSEQRYEEWIPFDESGTWFWRYTRPLRVTFPTPQDEAWFRAHEPDALVTRVELYTGTAGVITGDATPGSHTRTASAPGAAPQPGWQAPTSQWLATLPRDPGALLERIHHDSRGQGPNRDSEALVFVGDVLRSGLVPADLRAGLFRAAALIPGVRVIDRATNLAGRRGVAVGRDDYQLIFDPSSHDFLGERSGGAPGADALTGYTAVTVSVAGRPSFG